MHPGWRLATPEDISDGHWTSPGLKRMAAAGMLSVPTMECPVYRKVIEAWVDHLCKHIEDEVFRKLKNE